MIRWSYFIEWKSANWSALCDLKIWSFYNFWQYSLPSRNMNRFIHKRMKNRISASNRTSGESLYKTIRAILLLRTLNIYLLTTSWCCWEERNFHSCPSFANHIWPWQCSLWKNSYSKQGRNARMFYSQAILLLPFSSEKGAKWQKSPDQSFCKRT